MIGYPKMSDRSRAEIIMSVIVDQLKDCPFTRVILGGLEAEDLFSKKTDLDQVVLIDLTWAVNKSFCIRVHYDGNVTLDDAPDEIGKVFVSFTRDRTIPLAIIIRADYVDIQYLKDSVEKYMEIKLGDLIIDHINSHYTCQVTSTNKQRCDVGCCIECKVTFVSINEKTKNCLYKFVTDYWITEVNGDLSFEIPLMKLGKVLKNLDSCLK